MKAIVNVFLKNGVLDSQGKAVLHALSSHGFESVKDVRVGKQIIIELSETDENVAKEKVAHMCEELLANTVIEDYEIEIQA
ncbi:MAG: phosphoribosylformylglycinamidine synthase subunit PurS [Sulfuricurvum sp.]|nr:phosphoribosylformylglycinamidine synthase subunit PurS [Sulfuricurvum sp.]